MNEGNRMGASLTEIGENLRTASRVMTKDRWERMCLDTIVHVANATSGFVANDTGMPVCSVGSDAVEVSRIARAVRGSLRDLTASLQIETGRGAYDVVVLPGGWPFRDRKSAVLAWEHPTRCEADVAKLAEEIRAIFP